MKRPIFSIPVLLTILTVAVSCVKDKIDDFSWFVPVTIIASADIPEHTLGTDLPTYSLMSAGDSLSRLSNDHTIAYLPLILHRGHQILIAYTQAEHVDTESDRVARIERLSDGNLRPDPDYFYSAAVPIEVRPYDTIRTHFSLVQRIRQLTFEIRYINLSPERITRVEGTLEEVSGAFDLEACQNTDESARLTFPLELKQDTLSGCIRLLGFREGGHPRFTLNLTAEDGSTFAIETDLSQALSDFNQNMHIPLKLSSTLRLSFETGFTGVITPWVIEEEEKIELH